MTFLLSSALAPVLRTMMVSPTKLLAAVVGLLLTSALGLLHLLTNPVEGSSEHPSYETYSDTNHYNPMPGLATTGTGLELNARASTSYHPPRGNPPYHTMVSGHVPDGHFGITQ